MKAFIILALVNHMAVHAALDATLEFDPAYAADQTRITTESLQYETEQFQSLKQYHSLRSQVESAKRRRDRLQNDLAKAQKLAEKSYLSKDELMLLQFKAASAVNEVTRLEIEAKQAKAAMHAYRLRVLSEGGASQDLRKEIVLAGLEESHCQIKSLKVDLTTAELAERMWAMRVEAGKRLHESGAMSEDEYEDRLVSLRVAKSKVRGLVLQIRAAEASVKGLEQSLRRLEAEPNLCCRI